MKGPEPYVFVLGDDSRPITCRSAKAQVWFDRGLLWTYGFNHEEAARCFKKAIDVDADCAMAYWGLAYVKGPFINKTWDLFTNQERDISLKECYDLSQKALYLAEACTELEKTLIAAIAQRYQYEQVDSLEQLYLCNDSYAQAMRQAHEHFPTDPDINKTK